MRISFYTLGCKLNQAESYELEKRFLQKGHQIAPFGEPADFIIINSCAVTKLTEAETRKIARRAKRLNPNGKVCVVGCYPEYNSEGLMATPEVDFIIGQSDKSRLDEIIERLDEHRIWLENIDDASFFIAASADPEERTRATIKAQDGCDYFCAYCAVPFARGRSRSANSRELLEKIWELIEVGFKEVVLSGINLGIYRDASNVDFLGLLKLIENENYPARFRISSIEPNLLSDEIIDFALSSNSISPHFHIPLQSGSDEILKSMGRRYDTALFRERIERIKNKNPYACIGIDVIAGFPKESSALFKETLDFIESLPISYIHAFTYSDREKARASKEKDKVLKSEKKERTNRLRELSDLKKTEFYNKSIGSQARIIIEKIREDGLREGWSDNYIRCAMESNAETNEIISGEIYKIENGIAICK